MRVLLKLGIAGLVIGSWACAHPLPPPPAIAVVSRPHVAADGPGLSQDHCRYDTLCALSGFCTPHGDECIAAADSDCADSQQCLNDGACTARDRICVAASDAECRRSQACLREGRCRAHDSGYCQA